MMNLKRAMVSGLGGIFGLVVLCSIAAAWQANIIWQANISGSAANNFDWARAVTVDAAGDVLAAGVTQNIGTGSDFTVVKLLGETGHEILRQVISGSATNSGDSALAVTVDAAGDVVAAGRTENIGTSLDFTVVKLRGTDGGDF